MEIKSLKFKYPVWEMPEVQDKVTATKKFVYHYCKKNRLFGWRSFIKDLVDDLTLKIYYYEDLHLQGKYKELGAGAYCKIAKNDAINAMAACSTHIRKANYMLDTTVDLEEIEDTNYMDLDNIDIATAIGQAYGPAVQQLVEKVLEGNQLSRPEILELRKLKGLEALLKA